MFPRKIIQFLLLCTIVKGNKNNLTPPVTTEGGIVVGLYLKTILNQTLYSSFKGIPYADPPIKNLRFQPPRPKTSWNNTLYAFNDSKICIQMMGTYVIGSEDCLYLNVYSPEPQKEPKPVLVWIHGGAFTTGNMNSSYFGPDFLLEKNVVVVMIQYRLGALGFLNMNHVNASGNYGLKDQNLALKWIKKNIKNFGGDPNRITLMGQSAGGVSVDLHKMSNMSAGLFQQTISMSASPLCLYWALQTKNEAQSMGYSLGAKFGIKKGDVEGLIQKLLNVSASKIVKKTNELPMIPFRPTIEKRNVAREQAKFLTECVPNKYYSGNYNKGPHLMGFTSSEALSLTKSLDDVIKWSKNYAKKIKNFNFARIIPSLADLLCAIFESIATLSENIFNTLIDKLSDIYFVTGIDSKQRLLSKTNDAPIYYYRFDFKSSESAHKYEGVSILDGVAHEDELPYLFYKPYLKMKLDNPKTALMREILVNLWVNFAKDGNPTPSIDDLFNNVTWPDSRKNGRHLEISSNLKVKPRPINSIVTSLQNLGFGSSHIFNDCNQEFFSNIINGFPNLITEIMDLVPTIKDYFENFLDKIRKAIDYFTTKIIHSSSWLVNFIVRITNSIANVVSNMF